MFRKTPSWPLLALWGILWPAGLGWCQLPTPTWPEEAPAPPPKSLPRPPAYVLPPLNETPPIEPMVDPILNDPAADPPGFVANVELFYFRPHLMSHLIGTTAVSPTQVDTVDLKTAGGLGNAISPRIELGYRLTEQRGEFLLGYRSEAVERTGVPTDRPGGTSQKDRLNLNMIDLDWGNRVPFSLGPGWDIRFNVGVRVAMIYYDTRRTFGGPLLNPAGLIEQRATDNFAGVGPEAGLDLSRELFVPGLALVGRVSGAALFGEIRQTFSETTTSGGGTLFGSDSFRYQVEMPMLTVQAGLSYSPPGWNRSRFLLGYIWEEFWHIGRLNSSDGDLLNRGLFFRAEFNF